MLDHLEMFMVTLSGEVHSRLAATLHDLMGVSKVDSS